MELYYWEITLPSFPRKVDPRRSAYLSLASQVESQLREAYARRFAAGIVTQSSIAQKLGVNRSAVHHRLTGRTNMTIETIADMVWALGYEIAVKIYDPLSLTNGVPTNDLGITAEDTSPRTSGRQSALRDPAPAGEKLLLDDFLMRRKPKKPRVAKSNGFKSALEAAAA